MVSDRIGRKRSCNHTSAFAPRGILNDNQPKDRLHDVIIVGGRPAGATLAARLAAQGLSVLVVDKATFPSVPEVPSSPIIFARTMRMLEEIGVDESQYTAASVKIVGLCAEFHPHVRAAFDWPEIDGRNYIRGVDRAGFDFVLWNNLARYPTVTRRAQFAVSDLVRDRTGRVIGITGREKGGPEETFHAKLCVVGADGRHSLVARKVGAKIVTDVPLTSTVYYAEWEGLKPLVPNRGTCMHMISNCRGQNVIFFPTAKDRTYIVTHGRSDRIDVQGDPQGHYLGVLRSIAEVRRRIDGAQQVTRLVGIKRVANRYLEQGGPGWVLAGDAVHHKDPVDGQGIYDAVIGAKRLARILGEVHRNESRWESAIEAYGVALRAETRAMFDATMERIRTEVYKDLPTLMVRTTVRWMMQDPEFQRRLCMRLGRALPPDKWMPPAVLFGVMLRGIKGDIARAFLRQSSSKT